MSTVSTTAHEDQFTAPGELDMTPQGYLVARRHPTPRTADAMQRSTLPAQNHPVLIGLAGNAGAGKDTAGERLRSCHGFEVAAFADPLKTMIEALLVELGIDYRWLFERQLKEQPIPGLNVSARHLMQTLGTEWGRQHLGRSWWVRCTEIRLGMCQGLPDTAPVHDRIVLTDVRFAEEANWIRSWGGVIVRIDRPGQPAIPLATHASELQPIRADRVLVNDGTVDQLHERVDLLAAALLRYAPMPPQEGGAA